MSLIAAHGLVKGDRIWVDASTMEANEAMRAIVRRETGATYREMLNRMARESGTETPSRPRTLLPVDRKRKGKTLSNADWVSPTDPEEGIAKMKVGTTHLGYKPEHAVDLDAGAVVAAEIHPADFPTVRRPLSRLQWNIYTGRAGSGAWVTRSVLTK